VQGKVVPAHSMKAYRENEGREPLILNLSTRWMLNGQPHIMAALPPGKQPQYPPNRMLGEPPKLVCIFLRREKSLFKTWIVQALV